MLKIFKYHKLYSVVNVHEGFEPSKINSIERIFTDCICFWILNPCLFWLISQPQPTLGSTQ